MLELTLNSELILFRIKKKYVNRQDVHIISINI